MTTDILLEANSNGLYDINIVDGDIETTDGLDSAIIVSLLTDARADSSTISKQEYRRGWVGNTQSIVDGRQLGGLLWLTDQRRLTQETLNTAIDYAKKSLQWLIDDKIALKVDVSGDIIPQQGIALSIEITSSDGTTYNQYVKLWEATGL